MSSLALLARRVVDGRDIDLREAEASGYIHRRNHELVLGIGVSTDRQRQLAVAP